MSSRPTFCLFTTHLAANLRPRMSLKKSAPLLCRPNDEALGLCRKALGHIAENVWRLSSSHICVVKSSSYNIDEIRPATWLITVDGRHASMMAFCYVIFRSSSGSSQHRSPQANTTVSSSSVRQLSDDFPPLSHLFHLPARVLCSLCPPPLHTTESHTSVMRRRLLKPQDEVIVQFYGTSEVITEEHKKIMIEEYGAIMKEKKVCWQLLYALNVCRIQCISGICWSIAASATK